MSDRRQRVGLSRTYIYLSHSLFAVAEERARKKKRCRLRMRANRFAVLNGRGVRTSTRIPKVRRHTECVKIYRIVYDFSFRKFFKALPITAKNENLLRSIIFSPLFFFSKIKFIVKLFKYVKYYINDNISSKSHHFIRYYPRRILNSTTRSSIRSDYHVVASNQLSSYSAATHRNEKQRFLSMVFQTLCRTH